MRNRLVSRAFFVFLGAVFILGLSVVAEGAVVNKTLQLTAGKAATVDLGRPASDVLVASPAIADVGTLRSNRLYIVGKAVGDTNVLAFDEKGNQLADISVHVRVDEQSLRDSLRKFFPKEKIEVSTVKEDIVLRGRVSTPSVANQVRDFASRFITVAGKTVVDLMTVEGEQQVMLRVKVLEAKRSALREYGFETDYRQTNVAGGTFNTVAGTGLQSLAPFASGQLFIDDNGRFGPLKLAIQGMEKDGLVNTLAEPNLTAISGETAGFLAGGEFPVPVGRDQDGNITLEFKQFGVSLNFTPTVLSSDRISMQLSTEVSSKSDDDSVTLVNTKIPGLSVRRAETTVQMGSGGTVMIAGLIKSDTLDSLSGFPGAQSLPIIGELFKSKSFARNETELIILVTPYIVKPYGEPDGIRVSEDKIPAALVPPSGKAVAALPPASETLPTAALEPVVREEVKAEARRRPDIKAETAPAQANPAKESLLASRFMNNLTSVYGARAAQAEPAAVYGYIVD